MTDKIPTMLTIKETAKQTGLSIYMLRKLCNEGQISYINVGKKVLINLDVLTAYLNGVRGSF